MRVLYCPSCGANLQIDDLNRDFAFCQYCGSKIMLDDYRSTYRFVDEARIFEAETDRIIRLREFDIEEERRQRTEDARVRRNNAEQKYLKKRRKLIAIWLLVTILSFLITFLTFSLFLVPVFFISFFVGFFYIFEIMPSEYARKNGGIKFPKGLEPFSDRKAKDIERTLRNAGFKNIMRVNLCDIKWGFSSKEGKVESIKIDGEGIQDGGKYYMPDVQIVITFHGR